jgi:type IV pilus assembly protein PilA
MNRTHITPGNARSRSAARRNGFTRPDGFTLPNGFTLMELLIVISIILILMLMAIPTIGNMKKYANETSAKNSMQKIALAESQYSSTFPANGYACTLAALGGDPNAGPPTPTSAQMLDPALATGSKAGYLFTIGNCTKVTQGGTDHYTGYQLTAVPEAPGKSGDRGFCSDQNGAIKLDPAGGTNCTQPLQ